MEIPTLYLEYPNEGEPQALLSSFIERLERYEK